MYEGATFKLDKGLMKEIMKIFMSEIEPIRMKVGNAGLPIQLITKEEMLMFSKNGGNALGLAPEDAPLMREFSIPKSKFKKVCLLIW